MRLLSVTGSLVKKNVSDRIIDWDGKSLSKPQFLVKQFLKTYWLGHVVYEEFPVYGTKLRVDILNATLRIGVEVHGPQHESYHFFHGNSREAYLKNFQNDDTKRKWLELNEYKHIIIYTNEVDDLSEEFFLKKFDIKL